MHIYYSNVSGIKMGAVKKYKTIVFLVFRSEFSKSVIRKQKKTKKTHQLWTSDVIVMFPFVRLKLSFKNEFNLM